MNNLNTFLKQSGSSLIEILVSLFILSLVLLGLDAMQLTALKETKAAYYFSVAAQQLNNVIERLQALNGADDYEQLAVWNKENQDVLPQGRGVIHNNEGNERNEVSIYWGTMTEQACHENKIGQSGCLRIPIKI